MENPAIDTIVRTCVAVRLRALNRVITNLFDKALRPLGLKISQLNILVVAAKLRLAPPGKVCEILQLDTSTLSRNVERMRSKGWLEKVPGKDARMRPIQLSARGTKLLERAIPAWQQAQRQALELLGETGNTLLNEAAGKLGRIPTDR